MATIYTEERDGSFDTTAVASASMELHDVAAMYERWLATDGDQNAIDPMPNGDPTWVMLWGNEDE